METRAPRGHRPPSPTKNVKKRKRRIWGKKKGIGGGGPQKRKKIREKKGKGKNRKAKVVERRKERENSFVCWKLGQNKERGPWKTPLEWAT